MYLTNLKVVQRILPRHLTGVVNEIDQQVVMKGWFLDDSAPVNGEVLSAAQRFFRSAERRRWLDVTTGDLLTLFLLDAQISAIPSSSEAEDAPQDVAVDVLLDGDAGVDEFIRATHDVARIFDVRLDALPALVLYSSQDDASYVVISFRGLKTPEDVKDRCALVFQEIFDASVDVFGPTRTRALQRRERATHVTRDEAQQILRRVNTSINGKPYGDWFVYITGANAVYTLIEHIVKVLKHLT